MTEKGIEPKGWGWVVAVVCFAMWMSEQDHRWRAREFIIERCNYEARVEWQEWLRWTEPWWRRKLLGSDAYIDALSWQGAESPKFTQ